MQTLVFEKGLVDRIEEQIIAHLKQYGENESLLLDMSSIDFIRVEAMVYLTSFIASRKSKNLETKIKYYGNEAIRTFLYNSRFFETIRDVANIDIRDLVVDLPDYFDKTFLAVDSFNRSKYVVTEDKYTRKLTDDERIDHLRDKGFYPLVSLPFADDTEKLFTLKEEPKNWTEGKPLVSIIQKSLPDKVVIGDKISKHIIYESITNSIRHPNSDKLVISCIRPINQKSYYTLVIWDNGESIIDTLKNELRKGNEIKTEGESSDDPHSCYCIMKEKPSGRPSADNISYYFSNEVPTLQKPEEGKEYLKEEWFILLASFFPGITRDPKGIDYEESKALGTEKRPALTGRGLTYLVNAAVRNFDGEVRVRTSNYFINIKKAEKDYKTLPDLFFKKFKNEYYVIDMKIKYDSEDIPPIDKTIINSLFRVKVQQRPEKEANFYGNMITIQIPQRV
jgi:hypothetical protein